MPVCGQHERSHRVETQVCAASTQHQRNCQIIHTVPSNLTLRQSGTPFLHITRGSRSCRASLPPPSPHQRLRWSSHAHFKPCQAWDGLQLCMQFITINSAGKNPFIAEWSKHMCTMLPTKMPTPLRRCMTDISCTMRQSRDEPRGSFHAPMMSRHTMLPQTAGHSPLAARSHSDCHSGTHINLPSPVPPPPPEHRAGLRPLGSSRTGEVLSNSPRGPRIHEKTRSVRPLEPFTVSRHALHPSSLAQHKHLGCTKDDNFWELHVADSRLVNATAPTFSANSATKSDIVCASARIVPDTVRGTCICTHCFGHNVHPLCLPFERERLDPRSI